MHEKKNADIMSVYVVDDEFKIVSFNDILGEIYPDLKVGSFCYKELCHEQNPCDNCPILHHEDGRTLFFNQWLQQWIEVKVGKIPWPEKGICHVLIANNIMDDDKDLLYNLTQISSYEELLEKKSERNTLTGLYNESSFFHYAEEYLRTCGEAQQCLLAIDIEHFKLFNEWYGREAGDEFLISMATCLKTIKEDWGGIAGHFGGDNFVLIFPYQKGLIYYLQNKMSGIAKKFGDNAGFLPIFGVYLIEDNTISLETMYDRATIALVQAKGNYSTRLCQFQPSMIEKMEEEQYLLSWIQKAFDSKEISFYLQPQYNVQTRKIIGAEALMRWESPKDGIVSPGNFLPLLEKNGFIVKLDKYIWEEVCHLLREWLNEGLRPVPISVNVSRIDMYYLDVAVYFKKLIRKYQLDSSYIKIEITESAYVEEFEIVTKAVANLKNAGFKVIMDDFGSGYSSLNMLKNMNIDVLKLDMRFLHLDTDNSEKGISILESVISMARLLDMPVIAEGVETGDQLKILREMDCRYVQGYYYSKPLQKAVFASILRTTEKLDFSGFNSQTKLMRTEAQVSGLREKEVQSMELLLKYLPDNVFISRKNGQYVEYQVLANGISKRNGFTVQEYEQQLNERIFGNRIMPEDENRIRCGMREAENRQEDYHTILSFENKKEEKIWVSLDCYYIGEKDARCMCIIRDVTEEKRQEYQLDIYRKKLEKILEMTGINIWEWDIKDNTLLVMNADINNRLKKIYSKLGQKRAVIPDFPECFLKAVTIQDRYKQHFLSYMGKLFAGEVERLDNEEMLISNERGDSAWISVQGEIIYDENHSPVAMFGSFVDITDEKKEEQRLTVMAETDALTGLYNRHRAVPEMEKYLEEHKNETSALIMIDLDNLKQVNDTFGHAYGDMMILTMAQRIKNYFRKEDIVSRFGGDEFLILCKNITREVLECKLNELVQPVVVSDKDLGHTEKFTLSAGYVMIESNEESLNELYQKADKAMFDAKKNGKSNFAEYEQE